MFWRQWRTRETNSGDFCQDAGYHTVTNTRMVVHFFRQPPQTADRARESTHYRMTYERPDHDRGRPSSLWTIAGR
jgi:hypothetical protein